LVPIYHPSPQVLASHRREASQLQDYKVVAQAIYQAGVSIAALPFRHVLLQTEAMPPIRGVASPNK
jgi:hypothetical protein